MSIGVFRDPKSGEYRYTSQSDDPERWRQVREWDRTYGSMRQPPPSPLPPMEWSPPPGPPVPPPPVATPPTVAWTADAWNALVTKYNSRPIETMVVEWDDNSRLIDRPPAPGSAAAYLLAASEAAAPPPVTYWQGPTNPNSAAALALTQVPPVPQFDIGSPPTRVGDLPEFDAWFDQMEADGQTTDYLLRDGEWMMPVK